MTLVPSVTELILAELLYLQYEDKSKPIYLYINSTGTSKVSYFWVSRECIQCFTKFLSMTPPAFSAGGAEIRLRYWSICNIWYHEICQPASSHRGCRHSVGRSRDVARIRGKVGGKQLLGAELTDSENHQCFQGNRAALPSASIMIKQPIDAFRGQVQHVLRLSLTQVSSQLTYVSHRQPSLKFSEKRCAIQKSRRCAVLTLHSTKSD